jgi:hypothetical protein
MRVEQRMKKKEKKKRNKNKGIVGDSKREQGRATGRRAATAARTGTKPPPLPKQTHK